MRIGRAPRRRWWPALVALLSAGACRCASAQNVPMGLPVGDPAELGFDARWLERAGALIRHLVDTDTLSGAVLMVARNGRIAFAGAFGMADVERKRPMRLNSIFRLASATKIWTSVAAISLYEDGRFGLDAPVSDLVPELAHLNVLREDGTVAPAQREMTVRDLFRHTCGYGYGYEGRQQDAYRDAGILSAGPSLDWTHTWTLTAWVTHLATVPLAEEPASSFDYGLCHDILGLLAERAGGRPLDELLDERVLQPLGLQDTGFWFPDGRADRLANVYDISAGSRRLVDDARSTPFRQRPKAFSAGGGWDSPIAYGGLSTSAPDFIRLLQMLLDGGQLDDARVLGRKTVELFFENQLAGLEREDSFWPGVGFGLGTAVLYDPAKFGDVGSAGTIWWAGSNGPYFWVDPKERVVGVYMTQARPFDVGGTMDRVRRAVMTALVGDSGGPL